MREAVLHLSGYNYQNIYGVNYRVKEKITMADLAFRVQHVIKTEIDVTEAQLSRNNIETAVRHGQLCRSHTVRVSTMQGSTDYQAETVIIATGTQAGRFGQGPDQWAHHRQQRSGADTCTDIPKTLIVVGGGVIGVEYTCMFATLGVRVILVEKRPRLLEFADAEIVEALSYHLRDHRVTLRLNEEVSSVEETAEGGGGGESGEQEEAFGRRAAVRGRPAGQSSTN